MTSVVALYTTIRAHRPNQDRQRRVVHKWQLSTGADGTPRHRTARDGKWTHDEPQPDRPRSTVHFVHTSRRHRWRPGRARHTRPYRATKMLGERPMATALPRSRPAVQPTADTRATSARSTVLRAWG